MKPRHKAACVVCGEAWPCADAEAREDFEECHLCGREFHWKRMSQNPVHPSIWECRRCVKKMAMELEMTFEELWDGPGEMVVGR
jgi:hypothetical protein